jgi:phosphate/sulfate permease
MKTLSDLVASAWCFGQPVPTTHSVVEWLLVGLAAGTVAYAFYKAVRHTLYPGETSVDHVKWRILDDEEDPR